MMNYADIRRQVIDASLKSQKMGLVRGTSGNMSIRSDDGKVIAITPSGIPYEDLSPEMVPLVDVDGTVLEGDYRPSSELPMHLAVMRVRGDVNAIVHTHSKFATILSLINQPLPLNTIPLVAFAPDAGPIAIVPFELPGSTELGQAAVNVLGERGSAVILEMHGILAVGTSMDKAMKCAEYMEEGAEIAFYCRLADGKAKGIPTDHIQRMQEIWRSGRAL